MRSEQVYYTEYYDRNWLRIVGVLSYSLGRKEVFSDTSYAIYKHISYVLYYIILAIIDSFIYIQYIIMLYICWYIHIFNII